MDSPNMDGPNNVGKCVNETQRSALELDGLALAYGCEHPAEAKDLFDLVSQREIRPGQMAMSSPSYLEKLAPVFGDAITELGRHHSMIFDLDLDEILKKAKISDKAPEIIAKAILRQLDREDGKDDGIVNFQIIEQNIIAKAVKGKTVRK